ncbi:MAG TPA: periplasmic heavy metal sensor [Stellaceae bacterium]|nr:periplasmic heavy metal sensor [Stellaceae bacterium]
MSAVDPAGRPMRGRGRFGTVMLTLSLTLNIFVIAGLFFAHEMIQPPQTPVQNFLEVGRAMQLSDDQQTAFRQFIRTMRENNRTLRQHNEPLIDSVWDELAKPQPDTAKISGLVDQANDNRRANQKDTGMALLGFLNTLTPDQRVQFANLARQHPQPSALQRLLQR